MSGKVQKGRSGQQLGAKPDGSQKSFRGESEEVQRRSRKRDPGENSEEISMRSRAELEES